MKIVKKHIQFILKIVIDAKIKSMSSEQLSSNIHLSISAKVTSIESDKEKIETISFELRNNNSIFAYKSILNFKHTQ